MHCRSHPALCLREVFIPSRQQNAGSHRRKAGLQGRPDAARHSYASYYLARTPDVNKLKANMGHSRNSDTIFAHYRAAATPEAAAEYWSIMAALGA